MDASSVPPASVPVEPVPAESSSPRSDGRPGRPLSEAALAARRANLAKARAADKDVIYRPTRRRRAASRANIQKAIAWRRSPEGNAVARLNAFKHGLAVKYLPDLRARLGEAPENFEQHHQRVRQVFRPRNREERRLVERLARATWRRIRLFRAQARYECWVWRHLGAPAGKARGLTLEEISERAFEISKLYFEAQLVEQEADRIEYRIERILAAFTRERARGEGMRG
jgi:hypothetical protein